MQIDFTTGGNSDKYIVSGFSVIERLGRWAIGQSSSIKMPISNDAGRLQMAITVLPMTAAGRASSQVLRILAQGNILYQGEINAWSNIRFPLPDTLRGEVLFEFLHPTPITPASLGASTDTRPLAFFFKDITIEGFRQPDAQATASVAEDNSKAITVPVGSTVSPDVWVAANGWLFLIGGSNSVIRYYTDPEYFTSSNADAWVNLLLQRRDRLARYGIKDVHLAAPDKISVYPDLVRGDLPNWDRHPIAMVHSALAALDEAEVFVNPLEAFAMHPNREALFMKTDTHWSYHAGMAVAELVTERVGFPKRPSLEGREVRRYTMTLDLGRKIDPPVSEEAFAVVLRSGVSRIHANELAVKFEENARQRKPVVHNGINVVFRNDNPDAIDKCLVIFGDSFMDFQDSNTTVIFAEMFRETHFVWSPRIDYGYVARVDADIVMTELAERFMNQVPKDDYNLERDVAFRLANYPA